MLICFLLCALCTGYGFFIRSVRSGTRFYRVWFCQAGFFLVLGIGIRSRIWTMLPAVLRGGLIAASAGCMFLFILIEGFVLTGFFKNGPDRLDYIIVLGAQVKKTGPSIVLRQRLDKAIEYLNRNPETICIVSGGQGGNEPWPEAVGMAAYLKEQGIPMERVLLEDRSKTTVENLVNSRPMIPESASVGIITNDFHLARALLIGRKHGFADAIGISSHSSRLYLPNNMFREFFAMLLFLWRGI